MRPFWAAEPAPETEYQCVMMKTSIAPILLVASLAAPLTVRAAESAGVLAVSEPPGPSPDLVEVSAQLRAVLAERTPGVLEAAQLRERMTGQPPTASLSELDRAFAGALATYQASDYEGAIRTLRAVVEDLEKLPDSPEAFEQWTRAMLRLARAEQTVGRREEAQAVLGRLVRANPQVKVDATQYPPSFVKQVDEMRAQVKSAKSRRLTVRAQKGVVVFVDGREIGPAPVTVDLPPGAHRVAGSRQGLRVPGVKVDLSSEDATVELDLALAEALRPEAGPGLALPAADRARRIITASAWLGLDRVVTASFVRESDVTFLVGTLYDVRRGSTQREGRVRLAGKTPPPGGLAALASFLMTGQTSSLVAASRAQSLEVRGAPPRSEATAGLRGGPEPSPGPRQGRVLGWTSVGAGAAGVLLGGFAIYEGLHARSLYGDAKNMPRSADGSLYSPTDYNGKISDGDSARSLAIGTGIGAGVALASSAVLGYISYRQTGEVGPFRF